MFTVSYNGVHQAYQIALAAQEVGLLDRFFCSFYSTPGKWGGRLSRLLGPEMMKNRGLKGIDAGRVTEYPWPELSFKLHGRLRRLPGNAWIGAAHSFDRWAARRLEHGDSSGVVCAENCALQTFRSADRLGMRRVYDCPGINAEVLRQNTLEAAKRTGLPFVSTADTPQTTAMKAEEIAMAEVVLTYSDFHSEGVMQRGISRDQIAQIPLWADSGFWTPQECPKENRMPLKVLFVGGINLRKGVPFLIEAARKLKPHVILSLVGSLDPDVSQLLSGTDGFLKVIPPVSKSRLRDYYRSHDILVLPSLGDSFGFVTMEAMACGLPVIASTHCGAPLPDPRWRVPIFDSDAISDRLQVYLDQRGLLEVDGRRARNFAETFTPQRYRKEIGELLVRFAGAPLTE